MIYCSMLWNLLFTAFLLSCGHGINLPSNQLREVSQVFLRYTENTTNQNEFVVTWNSELKDGSFFSTLAGRTSAAFYSLKVNQRYVMRDWPKGVCVTEKLPKKADFPTENILSSGKKFNIIQLITGDQSLSVAGCSLESTRDKCVSNYKCSFVDPSRNYGIVIINTCTHLVWEVTVPLIISGKKKYVKYTMIDNVGNWTDADWLSAPTSGEKINLIDMYSVTPSGIYCAGRTSNESKTVPKLPKFFSMYVDEVHAYEPELRKVSFKVFDYKNHLVREDITPDPKHNPKLYHLFGNSTLQIVEDFNTGSRFVMDALRENCTILPLGFGLFATPMKDSHVRMKYSYELFNSDSSCWQYSGRVHVRGFPTDRFICQRKIGSYPDVKKASVETQELYFRAGPDGRPVLVLMRHIYIPVDKRLTTEFADYTWHVVNYRTDHTDHSLDIFDVTRCYSPNTKDRLDLMVMMEGDYSKMIREPHLYIKVRSKLAEVAGVPPHRITELHFTNIANKFIFVWFKLLGLPSSVQMNDHYLMMDRTSLQMAHERLIRMIDQGLVKLPGPLGEYRFLPHTLRLEQDREKSVAQTPDNSKQYTSGDMAALGLSSIGIGAIGSVMALLCFQRRRRQAAVAYYVKT